ncbi:Uncharacterized protein DB41_GL00110 [Neochlamydia sp. TUME1]|nr:Uncharacterized protein DB41_GL00110 [Neochlamydia sp. TUME1]
MLVARLLVAMKIQHSFYELTSKQPIQSKILHSLRRGALLKVTFEEGIVGYADCHPWEELGDLPLQTQLDLLQKGKCTRLTAQSIYFAHADAKARANKRNLLEGVKIPMSHYLMAHLDASSIVNLQKAWKNGFTFFKVKLGHNLSLEKEIFAEMAHLFPNAKWRLDFNAKLNAEQFWSFMEHLPVPKTSIDYIEDPFPFIYRAWKKAFETFKVPLAADEFFKSAYGQPEAAQVLIMKPAIQRLKQVDIRQRLIVTSYLDHPLGQMSAAYIASLTTSESCGLLSHHIYQDNPFSERINNRGPFLQPVQGYGLGFDELLASQHFE